MSHRAYTDLAHDYQALKEEHDRLLHALSVEIATRNAAIRDARNFWVVDSQWWRQKHAKVIQDALFDARSHAGEETGREELQGSHPTSLVDHPVFNEAPSGSKDAWWMNPRGVNPK